MLNTPPFRRAPSLLLRRPAVLSSVTGAATILAIVAAFTPLFLSSAESAALQRDLSGRCPASFAGKVGPFDTPEPARAALSEIAASHLALERPRLTVEGTLVTARHAEGGTPLSVRFLSRDGFREHIELVEGEDGTGAYIDEFTSEHTGIGPGELLAFTAGGEDYEVPVVAVYANLYDRLADPYWCSVEDLLQVNTMGDLPPPLVLVDYDTFPPQSELFHAVFASSFANRESWEVPVTIDGLTADDAREVAGIFDATLEGEPGDHLPHLLSDLSLVTDRMEALVAALSTSLFPLAGVVLFAALALVAGSGSYWVERRRAELEYLSVLGAGPAHLAVKGGLEMLPALVAGGVLGCGAANLLAGTLGPAPDVEASARAMSVIATVGAVAAGLIATVVVVGVRSRRLLDRRPGRARSLSWRIPALVVAVALALWVRRGIGDSAVDLGENQLVGSVDPLVLFFPLFAFLAVGLLVTELVIRAFPLLRRIGAGSHALYLASRRIVSAPTLVMALVLGSALPVATLLYATSLTRSANATVDVKGRSFVGSDVSTPIYRVIDPPPPIAEDSTVVIRMERVRIEATQVDVVGVDPETFPRGAFWDPSFSDRSLEDLLAALTPDDGPLPVLVANGTATDGRLATDAGDFDVTVVDQVEAFPGNEGTRPLIVVHRQAMLDRYGEEGRLRGARYLLWTRGHDELTVERSLAEAGIGFAYTIDAETALDQLKFVAIVWTFDFLGIYAALGGLIAVGGVLLYVDTRQRSRNLSYALARRMGLRRREHLGAGLLEIGALSGLGAAAGVLVARITAGSLYRALDPLPLTPPSPRWIGAVDLALLTLAVAFLVSALAALLAQRTADNADTSELLRHGD